MPLASVYLDDDTYEGYVKIGKETMNRKIREFVKKEVENHVFD